MFQSFEDVTDPTLAAPRVTALRARLNDMGLDGFIVPHADEHQSEYLPVHAERLFWLTGFSGSAGSAVIMADRAAIFVDGRYTLQVRDQVDGDIFAYRHLMEEPPTAWLKNNVAGGQSIGLDPWLHTERQVKDLRAAVEAAGGTLVFVDANPLDAVWDNRPPPPQAPVSLHPSALAGKAADKKIADIKASLVEERVDAAVLTACDSVAWLFNIRGWDVSHKPLALANAVIPTEGKPTIFMDRAKLSNAVADALSELADIAEPGAFSGTLSAMADNTVLLDPNDTPYAVRRLVTAAGGTVKAGQDPCVFPRARKNPVELKGARAAHVRDATPVARFLAWVDREAPKGTLDEITAAKALENFRAETGALQEISFETISGAGPNGAIVHYRVSESSNRQFDKNSLYLVDSGAQYLDGTTDITRTLAIGTPSADMIRHFTLVLKGHIRLSTARFPKGTNGAQLDALARDALWRSGLDYDHGTGHGVGSFLGVHEGPQRIAKSGTVAMEPGMILSNEPGYYKTGAYGIRIENLLIVTEPEDMAGGDRPMLGFETLTLAPIDRRLVDAALLSADERDWLNAYHRRVFETVALTLDEADRAWLEQATAPV